MSERNESMNLVSKAFNVIRGKILRSKGYSDYYATFYSKELKRGSKNKDFSKEDRKWAYKRGFHPWRIKQYELTEDNYQSIISDRDYFYLYPINNQYRAWIDDKLTMKYILSPFDRFLPRYYYHLMQDRDVMRLMDCPEAYDASYGGIVSLLKERKVLAAKMAAGTYGIGFYKLEFNDENYFYNGNKCNEDKFIEFLKSLDNYIITEFVEMHPDLKKLNPGSVNTIRVVVINEHGNDIKIPFAFMRIGTKKSGIVDNVAQGGMVCKIDINTGRFYDAEVLKNHVYEKAEFHPDTHEKMEGIVPNWDTVKTALRQMSEYYPQLKWLGYDIAITHEGFEIIEINSHQGLHKAHEYPKEVTDFLFSQLKEKMTKFGINRTTNF